MEKNIYSITRIGYRKGFYAVKLKLIFAAALLYSGLPVYSQQHDHAQHVGVQDTTRQDSTSEWMSDSPMYWMLSRNVSMYRNSSGTAWLTDNSPMFGIMKMRDKWNYMFHGSVFLKYSNQDLFNSGKRGAEGFSAPNWGMFMANRKIGKYDLFLFKTMISLDPLTVGPKGYPMLFQTGETYKGERLVDSQHPHELLNELAVGYTHTMDNLSDIFVYVAAIGEPALGPGAFMHRPSSLSLPSSPLAHHWQDATHVAHGVTTLGIRRNKVKIDASAFNGREPDENRYKIDEIDLNSASARITYNPIRSLSFQLSGAYLSRPEIHEPLTDQHRFTGSVIHDLKLEEGKHISTAFVWGEKHYIGGPNRKFQSFLLESNFLMDANTFFYRAEHVQKSLNDLGLHCETCVEESARMPISSLTVGYMRRLSETSKYRIDLGGILSGYKKPSRITAEYGRPVSGEVFLRIMPPRL